VSDPQKIHQLTPNERAREEQRAYTAWLRQQQIYNPPPEPTVTDLVSDNRKVMNILVAAVGWLPLILALVGLAAAIVSMDKTAAAFEASVAHKNGLFGAWVYIVALAAVVMTDLALVVGEFALVRDMLRKGLRRQVWTVAGAWRSLQVRLGTRPPLDYHEMPDQSLQFYVKFLFALIIAANVYAVAKVGNIDSLDDLDFENGLLMFTGIAGALSLRFLGRQLSHIVYDLAAEQRELQKREMYDDWRLLMLDLWEQEKPRLLAQAWHEKFLRKNKLPLDADSPYLLGVGEDGELEMVPFEPSLMPWQHRNGNR
jgi:hypothetical protein